eukprot:scaffold5720_cov127-Isochrysis_galbana.AAC.7
MARKERPAQGEREEGGSSFRVAPCACLTVLVRASIRTRIARHMATLLSCGFGVSNVRAVADRTGPSSRPAPHHRAGP